MLQLWPPPVPPTLITSLITPPRDKSSEQQLPQGKSSTPTYEGSYHHAHIHTAQNLHLDYNRTLLRSVVRSLKNTVFIPNIFSIHVAPIAGGNFTFIYFRNKFLISTLFIHTFSNVHFLSISTQFEFQSAQFALQFSTVWTPSTWPPRTSCQISRTIVLCLCENKYCILSQSVQVDCLLQL